jgi:phosphinothricin acetyltransferase
MRRMRIVDAGPEQLEAIAAIYADIVRSSPATFDVEPPPAEWWEEVLAHVDRPGGHLLLAALDEDGSVAGWAKSARWMRKAAYATTCEISVHVADEARGRGVGTAIYEVLFERLDASPLRLAVAGITQPNAASIALHRRFGFREVGTYEGVGVKFGRPWDVTWFQRPLTRDPR